jgi:hypothetical protein
VLILSLRLYRELSKGQNAVLQQVLQTEFFKKWRTSGESHLSFIYEYDNDTFIVLHETCFKE